MNDAPVTGGVASASGTEDAASITGSVPAASDVDAEALTYHVVGATPSGVTFNSDGSFSVAPSVADQALDTGESRVVTFNYAANDGTADSASATVTVTINGVNDAVLVNVNGGNLSITHFTSLGANITVTLDGVKKEYVVSSTQGNLSLNGGTPTTTVRISKTSVTGGLVADLGAGDDKLNLSSLSLNSTVHGGAGNDSIQGGSGKDHLFGDADNDTIIGNNGDDLVSGGTGTDVVVGNAGTDTLYEEITDASNVVVSATATPKSIIGVGSNPGEVEVFSTTIERVWIVGIGNFANTFNASACSLPVTLDGGAGNDILIGGGNTDVLLGGDGDDHLTGKAGTNALNGGEGTDTLVESGNVKFTLTNNKLTGTGTDNLTSLEVAELTGGVSSNTFTVNGWVGTGSINGNGGDDTITVVEDGNFTLTDTSLLTTKMNLGLLGFTRANLTGGVGTNVFIVSLWHGTGTMNGAGGVLDRIEATRDTDLTLANSSLASAAGSGFGTLSLSSVETANLSGGNSANKLIATTFTLGAVTLQGNGGDDVLIGGSKNDSLIGGEGRDLLIGRAGQDTLNGDAGEDILIGGMSTHSSSIAALNAIMAEWRDPAKSHSTRVDNLNLSDALHNSGANGTIKLNTATVLNDANAADSLTGGADTDWFFQFTNDALTDFLNNETKRPI